MTLQISYSQYEKTKVSKRCSARWQETLAIEIRIQDTSSVILFTSTFNSSVTLHLGHSGDPKTGVSGLVVVGVTFSYSIETALFGWIPTDSRLSAISIIGSCRIHSLCYNRYNSFVTLSAVCSPGAVKNSIYQKLDNLLPSKAK